MSDDWKLVAPCRAADPNAFNVPDQSDRAGWEQLRVTAETWCRGCPFIDRCAVDPAGGHGLWAGTARWLGAGKTKWRRLFPGAPEPQLTKGPRPTFATWVSDQRREAS